MKRHRMILGTVLLLILPAAVHGQMMPKGVPSVSVIKRLAVLDNGRVKPLDTYARSLLIQFSGRQSFERKPAVAWLVRHLFSPEMTRRDKVFLINNPAILSDLGIKVEKRRRYSFAQLEPHLDKLSSLAQAASEIPDKERDVVEAEVIRVFNNLRVYIDLSRVFQFAFPAKDFTIEDVELKKALDLPEEQSQFSFLDIALSVEHLQRIMDGLQSKDSALWTAQERSIVELVTNLFHWSSVYTDLPLAIIPSQDQSGHWISPWDAIRNGFQNEETRREMDFLRNVIVSYWNGEQIPFDVNARLFMESIKDRIASSEGVIKRVDLELVYNKADLFLYSKIFYVLAFILFLVSLAVERVLLYRVALGLVILGFAPHVAAIIMRIIILSRPPVSTLYETFIFVAFVVVLLGLVIEFFNRRWLGIVTSSVGGFILLMIAAKYSMEGDTLKMLVAVLNSNFWLATHVISISAGYGSACAAGILGHVYLLQVVFKRKDKKLLDSTYRTLMGMLGLALTLTFLGTNLGGIWADQSWGRFWGWDPKENGALMIVLWIAMLFHAKIARWLGECEMAIGAVLGTIVVVWAWFGVNLLSIGLHSYGFTSGVAAWIAVYIAAEIIFIISATCLLRFNK